MYIIVLNPNNPNNSLKTRFCTSETFVSIYSIMIMLHKSQDNYRKILYKIMIFTL